MKNSHVKTGKKYVSHLSKGWSICQKGGPFVKRCGPFVKGVPERSFTILLTALPSMSELAVEFGESDEECDSGEKSSEEFERTTTLAKKRTILEIRGEKNAVPRVISCSITSDQRRARSDPRLSATFALRWSRVIEHDITRGTALFSPRISKMVLFFWQG